MKLFASINHFKDGLLKVINGNLFIKTDNLNWFKKPVIDDNALAFVVVHINESLITSSGTFTFEKVFETTFTEFWTDFEIEYFSISKEFVKISNLLIVDLPLDNPQFWFGRDGGYFDDPAIIIDVITNMVWIDGKPCYENDGNWDEDLYPRWVSSHPAIHSVNQTALWKSNNIRKYCKPVNERTYKVL